MPTAQPTGTRSDAWQDSEKKVGFAFTRTLDGLQRLAAACSGVPHSRGLLRARNGFRPLNVSGPKHSTPQPLIELLVDSVDVAVQLVKADLQSADLLAARIRGVEHVPEHGKHDWPEHGRYDPPQNPMLSISIDCTHGLSLGARRASEGYRRPSLARRALTTARSCATPGAHDPRKRVCDRATCRGRRARQTSRRTSSRSCPGSKH